MRTPRFLRIAIPVVGALLVAGGAIAVTASAAGLRVGSPNAATTSPAPKNSTGATGGGNVSPACQAFMGHLATQLGVSQSKLDAAASAAAKATVQDQVTNGKLTQAQADVVKAKLPRAGLCSGAISELGKTRSSVARGAYLTAAASALGLTEAQLNLDLKNGQNLSEVAAAQKVSEADFKTRVMAALKTKLDAAVAAKAITQTQEDAQLAKLQGAAHPPLWSSTRK